MAGWMENKWMDRRMNGWMDRWLDGWIVSISHIRDTLNLRDSIDKI